MDLLKEALGTGVEATKLTTGQVCLRALIVFFAALVIVRFADKRFFARKNAFDVNLGFILASMMARAINGSEQLLPTIVAAFLLATLHRFLGWIASRWERFSGLIKGHGEVLIQDGRVNDTALARHHIGKDDLVEELRLNGVETPDEVKLGRLERSGDVSIIKKE
jgi:uncharacterized membrane protein YcaP (DUF421 family)